MVLGFVVQKHNRTEQVLTMPGHPDGLSCPLFFLKLVLRPQIKGLPFHKIWAMQGGKVSFRWVLGTCCVIVLCDWTQVTFTAVVFLGPLNCHMSLYGKWDINERGFNFRIPPSFTCNIKGHETQQPICQYIVSSNINKAELQYSTFSHPCILVTTM